MSCCSNILHVDYRDRIFKKKKKSDSSQKIATATPNLHSATFWKPVPCQLLQCDYLPLFSFPTLRHQMVYQLSAVLCRHPAWLLTLPRPRCRLTWPTAPLLPVMWLDTGGNMPAAPHCPPTTVTFPHRWRSRECRQPEKVVTLSRLLHSDGKFCPYRSFTPSPSAYPPPLPWSQIPALLPSAPQSWLTDSNPLCWWHLNISCHNFSLTESLTWL